MDSCNDPCERLVRIPEAAAMLSVCVRTVWRMIAEGQLTPVRVRRCTRVPLAEILSILKGGRKEGVN